MILQPAAALRLLACCLTILQEAYTGPSLPGTPNSARRCSEEPRNWAPAGDPDRASRSPRPHAWPIPALHKEPGSKCLTTPTSPCRQHKATLGAIFTPASAMSCSHPGQAPHGSWATQTIPRWLRGQTHRPITRYRSDQPDSFTCEFEAPFARLEYVSRDRFDLSYDRHTGEWYFQASSVTLPPMAGRGRRKTLGNRYISCTRIRSGDSPNSMSAAKQRARTSRGEAGGSG